MMVRRMCRVGKGEQVCRSGPRAPTSAPGALPASSPTPSPPCPRWPLPPLPAPAPSGSYLKREGRPKDDDVLVARLVDRPLRPMFEKGWSNDTQVRV
jgi:hypothetical protein